MSTIELVTRVMAPQKRCFDLTRSIDLHVRSASKTDERAIAGVTTGLISGGEEVTWEAKHFGVRQRFKSKITSFDPPRYFQDSMVRGVFKRFVHDHMFAEEGGGTTITDRLEFEAPGGPLGRIVDRILLSSYLERFIRERNEVIKRVAESDGWREYLGV
jgi:ligand-binding SRPBCC domain-containing protein